MQGREKEILKMLKRVSLEESTDSFESTKITH